MLAPSLSTLSFQYLHPPSLYKSMRLNSIKPLVCLRSAQHARLSILRHHHSNRGDIKMTRLHHLYLLPLAISPVFSALLTLTTTPLSTTAPPMPPLTLLATGHRTPPRPNPHNRLLAHVAYPMQRLRPHLRFSRVRVPPRHRLLQRQLPPRHPDSRRPRDRGI